ncbi:MAG: hypothetical protein HOG03_05110 [Desulfobacula sp.]|jgi:uncharacterized membrane protein YfcA|uniref:hypothetical protein n=1 Tax=Desulfobacula sp. TaxID=2593537 RepID=UPI001DD6265C|nr:hypothetical protein [Desulfobacula sp.]MBT3484592.1 hypothetical protein [Desulfobacula sp.]MBT3803962.1 hypothetical protein [Desulfobacula sp.]MBT4023577.1 hypothetical protein [Desulfobacula sp.]MBT4197755.1 hypothetical protein [Desulfobacula sp.]
MFFFTGCVILATGIYMVIKGRNKNNNLKKYEDENRLADGMVYFKNIEASRTHGAKRNLYRVITVMGFFTGLFGLIFIGYGVNIFTHTM